MISDREFKIRVYSLRWLLFPAAILLALGTTIALLFGLHRFWRPELERFLIFAIWFGFTFFSWQPFYAMWFSATRVRLLDTELEVENGYWVTRRYPYSEIVRLRGRHRFGRNHFDVYTSDSPNKRAFELHPNIYKFGRMIENLVPRLPDLVEFSNLTEISGMK
ncbi:MAG: hypothetical protein KDK23_14280, partial [Leptospiraceae bacterium]|nr:hypothetical protein [Leptospiraceae bacterium]